MPRGAVLGGRDSLAYRAAGAADNCTDLGAVTPDGVRVVTADTVSITGARRQQLGRDSQHSGVILRKAPVQPVLRRGDRQGGCCSVQPLEQDRAGPAAEGQLER